MRINPERLRGALAEMNRIGATPRGGVSRLALTDEDRAARDLFVRWAREASLAVRVDDMGTIYARRTGSDPLAAPVLTGSHLDSVPRGGRLDGVLGVLAALEVVRTLNDHGVATHHPVEVVNFTNEEGVRFEPALMASGVLAGAFTPDYVYSRKDRQGFTFGAELERIGYKGSATDRPGSIRAFVELHIEQGPVLEAEGYPVGAVDGILGITWLEVVLTGQADHAGPSPMSKRRDPLAAAARIIDGIRAIARAEGDPAVVTVGRLNLEPGAINVIPGKITFSIDVRHREADGLARMEEAVRVLIKRVCAEERVEPRVEVLWRAEPTHFDPKIVDTIKVVAADLGYRCRQITSGAGHDARYMSQLAPTGMIFVQTKDGKSHCEEEDAPWDAVEQAANVLLHTVLRLAGPVK